MKKSRRAKRMERHYLRAKRNPGLNMVSLIDIFTVLVFFLLIQSSNVQEIPSAKFVRLPESVSQEKPEETVVVAVSASDIYVQGRKIATVGEVMGSGQDFIEPLKKELDILAARPLLETGKAADNKAGRPLTILGDKEIPYQLLKKIMVTCSLANYSRISLAVLTKSADKG